MQALVQGNLTENKASHPELRGWFIGHFINTDSPFHSNEFEVKWNTHKKGATKATPGKNVRASSLAILIQGQVTMVFDNGKEIQLQSVGDYVYWPAGIGHDFRILEDSIVLTIRWPSLSSDQVPAPKLLAQRNNN